MSRERGRGDRGGAGGPQAPCAAHIRGVASEFSCLRPWRPRCGRYQRHHHPHKVPDSTELRYSVIAAVQNVAFPHPPGPAPPLRTGAIDKWE